MTRQTPLNTRSNERSTPLRPRVRSDRGGHAPGQRGSRRMAYAYARRPPRGEGGRTRDAPGRAKASPGRVGFVARRGPAWPGERTGGRDAACPAYRGGTGGLGTAGLIRISAISAGGEAAAWYARDGERRHRRRDHDAAGDPSGNPLGRTNGRSSAGPGGAAGDAARPGGRGASAGGDGPAVGSGVAGPGDAGGADASAGRSTAVDSAGSAVGDDGVRGEPCDRDRAGRGASGPGAWRGGGVVGVRAASPGRIGGRAGRGSGRKLVARRALGGDPAGGRGGGCGDDRRLNGRRRGRGRGP